MTGLNHCCAMRLCCYVVLFRCVPFRSVQAVAILPQLYLFHRKGGEVESFTSHFVVCLGVARVMHFAFWLSTHGELENRMLALPGGCVPGEVCGGVVGRRVADHSFVLLLRVHCCVRRLSVLFSHSCRAMSGCFECNVAAHIVPVFVRHTQSTQAPCGVGGVAEPSDSLVLDGGLLLLLLHEVRHGLGLCL